MNTYTIELTETAEIDVDNIYLRYNRNIPDQVDRWHSGFTKSLSSLSLLPNRCPIAREDARFNGITVRQLLFGKYRILFHVVEPYEGENEGRVRIMRVIHGSRTLDLEDKDAEKPPNGYEG